MNTSPPPGGGPTFNQILVIFLIAAIVVLGALMIFDPQLRRVQPQSPPLPPQLVHPNSSQDGPPN